jgi:hypothetical protein
MVERFTREIGDVIDGKKSWVALLRDVVQGGPSPNASSDDLRGGGKRRRWVVVGGGTLHFRWFPWVHEIFGFGISERIGGRHTGNFLFLLRFPDSAEMMRWDGFTAVVSLTDGWLH